MSYSTSPPSSSKTLASAAAWDSARSISTSYQHCSGAVGPIIISVPINILYIFHVAMYWEILFFPLVMYSSIGSSTYASIASTMGGYTQILSGCRQSCFPVRQQATQLWKPPSFLWRRGFTRYVYEPKSRMDWTISLKNVSYIFVSTLYCPRIRNSCSHFFLAFLGLSKTDVQ